MKEAHVIKQVAYDVDDEVVEMAKKVGEAFKEAEKAVENVVSDVGQFIVSLTLQFMHDS